MKKQLFILNHSHWTRGSKNWRHKTYSFLYIQFGRPINHSDKKYIILSKKGPFSWSVKFYFNYILNQKSRSGILLHQTKRSNFKDFIAVSLVWYTNIYILTYVLRAMHLIRSFAFHKALLGSLQIQSHKECPIVHGEQYAGQIAFCHKIDSCSLFSCSGSEFGVRDNCNTKNHNLR